MKMSLKYWLIGRSPLMRDKGEKTAPTLGNKKAKPRGKGSLKEGALLGPKALEELGSPLNT